jgi:MFS family permease
LVLRTVYNNSIAVDTAKRPWINLAAAALAIFATLPGRTQGLGLITEPLLTDLHLDRVTYASFNLWATLIGALFCIPFGRMMDRFGARIVLTIVVAALGATVLGMSYVSDPSWMFAGITLTRGFGQSALSVASLALVGKWFDAKLPKAMGIYSLLVGIGFVLAFPTVGAAVLAKGWRFAWQSIGIALLIIVPILWFLVRDRRTLAIDAEPLADAGDFDFRMALQHPAFWVFAISSSIYGLVASGISLFNQSILEQRGFDASVFHTTLVIITLVGLACNFAAGYLATKYSIRGIMAAGMAVLMLSLLFLPHVRTFTHVVVYAIAMGAAGGVVTVVFFTVWGQVFGKTHLGRIQGGAQMMTVLASAIGPLVLAETLQRTGSYDGIFYALGVLVGVLGLFCWIVPVPKRDWATGDQVATSPLDA